MLGQTPPIGDLRRLATASPTGSPPGCSVDSPDHCPAARRAQVQHFPDSEALDSCPKLQPLQRPCQALCVPVSITGRTVGVMHATRPVGDPFPNTEVSDLETLAKLAGTRIGLLRIMSETQLQAATDGVPAAGAARAWTEGSCAVTRFNVCFH